MSLWVSGDPVVYHGYGGEYAAGVVVRRRGGGMFECMLVADGDDATLEQVHKETLYDPDPDDEAAANDIDLAQKAVAALRMVSPASGTAVQAKAHLSEPGVSASGIIDFPDDKELRGRIRK